MKHLCISPRTLAVCTEPAWSLKRVICHLPLKESWKVGTEGLFSLPTSVISPWPPPWPFISTFLIVYGNNPHFHLTLTLERYVTWGKFYTLFELNFPHLQNEDKHIHLLDSLRVFESKWDKEHESILIGRHDAWVRELLVVLYLKPWTYLYS